jgi:hypothetical protein
VNGYEVLKLLFKPFMVQSGVQLKWAGTRGVARFGPIVVGEGVEPLIEAVAAFHQGFSHSYRGISDNQAAAS